MSVSIGDNIRVLRIKAGMTQSRLAERLGVTDQAVSKWETGAASPDLSLIVPLTRLFGVTADALLASTVRQRKHGGRRSKRSGKKR